MSELLLGGGLPPPTPSALTPVPAEWPGNAQNASACRGKRLDRGLKNAQNANPKGLLLWGSPTLFPLPVDEKGIKKCTAGKQAHDGLFPYLSMERPFRALSKALGFQALHEGLGQP